MSGLLDSGPQALEGEEGGVRKTFVGQVKLHLRCQGFGVRFVSYIDVWYKTENTLVLFRLDLLGGNFLRRIGDGNCSVHCQHPECDFSETLLLPRFNAHGRTPLCKPYCGDGDRIGNARCDVVECKRSIVLDYSREGITDR